MWSIVRTHRIPSFCKFYYFLVKRKQTNVQTGKKAHKIDDESPKSPIDYPSDESTDGKGYHNALEKKRRDKMNTYLQEIRVLLNENSGTLLCSKNDKLTILKSAHKYLRGMRGIPNVSTGKIPPSFLLQEELTDIIGSMDCGFIMLTNAVEGTIVWNFHLDQHLGYQNGELLGTSIYSLLNPSDIATYKQYTAPNITGSLLITKKRSFLVNLLRKPKPRDPTTVQTNPLECHDSVSILLSGEMYDIKTSALMGDRAGASGLGEHMKCFIAIGQGLNPELMYATKGLRDDVKVISREGPDGKIEHIHDSIFYLLGYIPTELYGHTLFEFVHPHDSRRLYTSFFEASNSRSYTNSVVLRLKQKSGMYQTVGIKKLAVRHPTQDTVVSFVSCMDEMVTSEENWDVMFPSEEPMPGHVYDPAIMMRQESFKPRSLPAAIGMDPSQVPSYPRVIQPDDFEGDLSTLFDAPIYLKEAVETYEYAQNFVEDPNDGVADNSIQATYDSLQTTTDYFTNHPF